MRIVEHGKKFIPGGTTDFIVLAATDEKITSSVDFFRRAILNFPSNTSFTGAIGNLSCGFFSFPEGYLFAQIQSRREDEIEGEKSRMKRPYIQSRFSFLEKEELPTLLEKDVAVYTSLLFNNQMANKKGEMYKLPDYGFFDEKVINPISMKWKSLDEEKKFLESHSLYDETEINYVVNLLYENFNLQRNLQKKVDFHISLRYAGEDNKHRVFYMLYILQKAQQELFPICGDLSFVLGNIPNQRVNIHVRQGMESQPLTTHRNIRNLTKTISHYRSIYDSTFSIYYKNNIELDEIVLIHKAIFEPTLSDGERKLVIKDYFKLLEQSEDIEKSINLLSTEARVQWAAEEIDGGKLGQKLWELLSNNPKEVLLACTRIKNLEITSEPAKLLIDILPQLSINELSILSEDQYKNFWRFSLNLYLKLPNTKFIQEKNILVVFCELVFPENKFFELHSIFWEFLSQNNNCLEFRLLPLDHIGFSIAFLRGLSEMVLNIPDAYANAIDIQKAFAPKILLSIITIPNFGQNLEATKLKVNIISADDLLSLSIIIKNLKVLFQSNEISIIEHATMKNEQTEKFADLCNWLAIKRQSDFLHFWILEILRVARKDALSFKKYYLSFRNILKLNLEVISRQANFLGVMQLEGHPQTTPIRKLFLELFIGDIGDTILINLVDTWLSEDDIIKNLHLHIDDVIDIINILHKNEKADVIRSSNTVLVKVANEQQDKCRQLPSDTALNWLLAATQERVEQGRKYTLYNSYNVTSNTGESKNLLFVLLNNLENSSAELIWQITKLPEVRNFSSVDSKHYLALWVNKLKITKDEPSEALRLFLLEFATITQKGEVTGEAISILHRLVETSFTSESLVCQNDSEAFHLISIYLYAKNSEIKKLAENSVQTYLESHKGVKVDLVARLLISGFPVGSNIIKNYISILVSENKLRKQLAEINMNGVLQIYKSATENSMHINIVQIIEMRLQELGVDIPSTSTKSDSIVQIPVQNNTPEHAIVSKDEEQAIEDSNDQKLPGKSGDDMPIEPESNSDSNYIKVNKVFLYSTIGFLVVFIIIDIMLLISYMQLLELIQASGN
jgi:hypothetical protein